MGTRSVQFLMSDEQRAAIIDEAKKQGMSLSEFLRAAALEKAGREDLIEEDGPKRRFLAFEYAGGRHTTTGEPNQYTGKTSIAGKLIAFPLKHERDAWVEGGPDGEPGYVSGVREAVSVREAKNLCGGMTQIEFEDYLDDVTR